MGGKRSGSIERPAKPVMPPPYQADDQWSGVEIDRSGATVPTKIAQPTSAIHAGNALGLLWGLPVSLVLLVLLSAFIAIPQGLSGDMATDMACVDVPPRNDTNRKAIKRRLRNALRMAHEIAFGRSVFKLSEFGSRSFDQEHRGSWGLHHGDFTWNITAIRPVLFRTGFLAILSIAMTRFPARQAFALFLGVLVALGMSLSAVQAGNMAAKMAVASDMGASGHNGCGGCGGSGDAGGAKAMVCAPACVAPVLAVLPQASPMTFDQPRGFSLRPYARLLGHISTPDPYPPRPNDLG